MSSEDEKTPKSTTRSDEDSPVVTKKSKKEKKHHKKKDKSSHHDGGILSEKTHIRPEHKPLLREILNQIEDLPIAIQFRDPYPWRSNYYPLINDRTWLAGLPPGGEGQADGLEDVP